MRNRYPRSLDALRAIVDDTARCFAEHGIDPALRMPVDLAIEELFVNMIRYNRETKQPVLIEMHPRGRGVEVSLTDFDVDRFDPTHAPPVDVHAPLEQREPRGLGLYLVLKMVDTIQYEYRDRQSRITFVKEAG
jgi:anti-sigma regulatory factor (Ser/Thr protein kinase)